VRRSKNYHAHVENKTQKVGDTVSIEETRPISKLKRWRVIEASATGNEVRSGRIQSGGETPPSGDVPQP